MRAAQAARGGFAIGWAQATADHPIAVGERAKRTCLQLMNADDSATIAETSIRRGHLEGTWQIIYDRRQELENHALAGLRDALLAIAADIDWTQVLTSRRESSPGGLDPADIAAASAQAGQGLRAQRDTAAWKQAVAHIHGTLQAAIAEGNANAIAQLGSLMNINVDFDIAYSAGYDALDGLQMLWDDAGSWMTQIVGDLTNQLGRTIAAGWRDGLSIADQEAAVMDLLGADRNAASFVLDQMIGHSLADGSVATYGQAGLAECDFLTAGDERVDAQCDEAESGNPWPLADAPRPPLHGMCRCTLAPAADSAITTDMATLLDPYTTD